MSVVPPKAAVKSGQRHLPPSRVDGTTNDRRVPRAARRQLEAILSIASFSFDIGKPLPCLLPYFLEGGMRNALSKKISRGPH